MYSVCKLGHVASRLGKVGSNYHGEYMFEITVKYLLLTVIVVAEDDFV